MKLEESLNGCFNGLYAEVVTNDSYRLRQLDFTPDIIFDLGANVGCFTRFAHELFPNAWIIAVEPNPENRKVWLEHTKIEKSDLIKKAIGRGKTWRKTDVTNGSNEEYLSISDHINEQDMENNPRAEVSNVELIMPDKLLIDYCYPDDNVVMKIDIEGNENTIWEHKESLEEIANRVDYLVAEIHPHAFTGIEKEKAKQNLMNAIEFLKKTHDVEYEHIYLFAKKRWA
jgi:FkbM family methyltransferase